MKKIQIIRKSISKLDQTVFAEGIGSNSKVRYNRSEREYEVYNASTGKTLLAGDCDAIVEYLERDIYNV